MADAASAPVAAFVSSGITYCDYVASPVGVSIYQWIRIDSLKREGASGYALLYR